MSAVQGRAGPASLLRVAASALLLLAAACAGPPDAGMDRPAPTEVAALSGAILALGPGIDGGEATQAAQVALATSQQLAVSYGVTDPPLIHNTKVNMGLRPRGLCYHWADDLEARLRQEGFQTLELHRAIANSDNPFRIEHSTVIVSRRGDPMSSGVVLDPWRDGGDLFWAPIAEDSHYAWVPRNEVFAAKRDRRQAVTRTQSRGR